MRGTIMIGNEKIIKAMIRAENTRPEVLAVIEGTASAHDASLAMGYGYAIRELVRVLYPTLDMVARTEILGDLSHEVQVEASAVPSHR